MRERVETQILQAARSMGSVDKERPERNQLPEPETRREDFQKHLTLFPAAEVKYAQNCHFACVANW